MSAWKPGPDLYRTCLPGPDPERSLCVIVTTDQSPPGVTLDRSQEPFTVPEDGLTYWVNDASTSGDEYATAAGDNRNTGKSAGAPHRRRIRVMGHGVFLTMGKPRSVWQVEPSWMLAPSPMVMCSVSPRTVAPNQTLASASIVTAPITWALSATQAEGAIWGLWSSSW